MNKQIRVLESQNKGKKEREREGGKINITFKGPIIKWLYTSQKQYKKLQKKGALFFKFSKNMKQFYARTMKCNRDTFRHSRTQKAYLSCTLTKGDAITESVNQERQQQKQKHHKDDDEGRSQDVSYALGTEGNNQTGTNQRLQNEADRISNVSKYTESW